MQPGQISDPSLTDVLDSAKRDTQVTLNCTNIGQIESFDSATQTANIQILLKQVLNINADGTKTIQAHPLLVQCPVVTMFGGSSFINLPIAKGDTCLVFFNDREIDNWLFDDGEQTPTTPRVHNISDGMALVGIRSFQNSIADFLANGIRAWFSANSNISLTDNAVDSLAGLWTHTGDFHLDGNFSITGTMTGENGAALVVDTDITQVPGKVLKAGNGVSGTFDFVTVQNGIVVGGS